MTSCRCNPGDHEWKLFSITEEIAFSNGMKKEMSYNGYLGIDHPWGSRGYAERCVVEFLPDGEFKMSLDGEWLPEVGYHVNKKFWRRGIASEAARAARDWAFQNRDFPALYSYMTVENIPSRLRQKVSV